MSIRCYKEQDKCNTDANHFASHRMSQCGCGCSKGPRKDIFVAMERSEEEGDILEGKEGDQLAAMAARSWGS